MLIDLYCPFYNEEKIVKHIANYWKLLPLRKIFLFDNMTTDSSLQYLKDFFPNQVETIINPDKGLNDINHMLFKNNAWKNSRGKVDFVLVCDFDEVIYSLNIIKSLEFMKSNNGTIANMPSFYLVCDDENYPKDETKLIHLQNNIRFSYYNNKENHKKILFDPNKIETMNYGVGSHFCNPTGDVKYFNTDICFFHATHLGLTNTIQKWRRNENRLSDINKKMGMGTHYNQSVEEITKYFNDLMINSLLWDEIQSKSLDELLKY